MVYQFRNSQQIGNTVAWNPAIGNYLSNSYSSSLATTCIYYSTHHSAYLELEFTYGINAHSVYIELIWILLLHNVPDGRPSDPLARARFTDSG